MLETLPLVLSSTKSLSRGEARREGESTTPSLLICLWILGPQCCPRGFSSCSDGGHHPSLQCWDFSLWWLLLWSMDSIMRASVAVAHGPSWPLACGILPDRDQISVSHCCGFFCGAQALRHPGLVVPQYVGSSMTRDQTMSPALAGGFLTTGPPGKPPSLLKRRQYGRHGF